jgi:DNA-binding MarR family transcriptional regulator
MSEVELKTAENEDSVSCARFLKRLEELFAEVNALANRLRKSGDDGDTVQVAALSVLRILHRDGPLTVPEIARIRATSRQNIQILVNRLVAAGQAELRNNPAHKRSVLVQITVRGRDFLSSATEQETKSLARLWPGMSEAKVVSAAEALRQLRGLLAETRPWPMVMPKTKSDTGRGRNEDRAQAGQSPGRETTGEEFPLNLL